MDGIDPEGLGAGHPDGCAVRGFAAIDFCEGDGDARGAGATDAGLSPLGDPTGSTSSLARARMTASTCALSARSRA
jgi:hypothetical protein